MDLAPVHAQRFSIGVEWGLEVEGKGGWAVIVQVLQPLRAFRSSWRFVVAGPPADEGRPVTVDEPVVAELTNEAFGSVPKIYVRATLDKVLSPALQDRMLSGWDVEQVFTLESGHFPLMSMPERLVEVLDEAAGVSVSNS